MSPRTGRPSKQDSPRNINLNIRLTEKESELIKECSNKFNLSRTDTIIKGINLLMESTKK